MINDIRAAWKAFDDCQKAADLLGFGGDWRRLSLTRAAPEFSALTSRIPEPYLHRGALLRFMYEGVSWLRVMQRHVDSRDEATAKQALEHAIACFGFAREQYQFLQQEDCEAS